MCTYWQQHKIALLIALTVGIITVLPSLFAPLELKGGYQGIVFSPLDDEDLYRGMVHEVLDGHPFVTSPLLYEEKATAPVVIAPVNLWLYALPAMLFGLSFVLIASKFILPALLFYLVYILVRRLLGRNRNDVSLVAVCAGLLVVFGYEFLNYHHLLSAVLHGDPVAPPVWTRLVNPITGVLEFTGFLIVLARMWYGEMTWRHIGIAGVLLAASVGYYFTFGMCLAVLGSLGLIALMRKEFAAVRAFAYIAGVSIVLDAPYWWNVLSLRSDALTATRNGMSFTHMPLINNFVLASTTLIAALFFFSYVWQKRRDDIRTWLFISALMAASWIAFNEQVITGRVIWYHHFVQFTIPLGFICILTASYLSVRPLFPRLWRLGIYAVCAVSMISGLFSITSFRAHPDVFAHQQTYAPLFTWLEQNAPSDCVVYVAGSEYGGEHGLDRALPAYTQCNVYRTGAATFIQEKARIEHNYFLGLRLDGITPGNVRTYLRAHEDEVRDTFFETWEQQNAHGVEDQWMLDTIDWLVSGYTAFYATDTKAELLKYRLDYIVSSEPLSSLDRTLLPGLTEKARAGNFIVYSF